MNRRDLIRIAAVLPLFPALAHAAGAPRKGDALPLVDLPLLEGGIFKASDASARLLVVYWWASWCPFCAEMTPHVEKLWREHRDRGLAVLGISIDKTAEAALSYRRRRGYTFPSALYAPALERYLPKPRTIPTTWVRDRQGRVVMNAPGQMFPEDVADIAKLP